MDTISIQTPNYEGPLELLLHLAQKQEIDLEVFEIKQLIEQIFSQWSELEGSFDSKTEALMQMGLLLWLKSCRLLPQETKLESDESPSPNFTTLFIEHLREYCLFKEAARHLSLKFDADQGTYHRPALAKEDDQKTPLGIEHLSIVDLAQFFQVALKKMPPTPEIIKEDPYKVADFIQLIRKKLEELGHLLLESIFLSGLTRAELIVYFLTILELMKMGEIHLIRDINFNIALVKTHERN